METASTVENQYFNILHILKRQPYQEEEDQFVFNLLETNKNVTKRMVIVTVVDARSNLPGSCRLF